MESVFAFFGIGAVLGILFSLFLLIPLCIYIIYLICDILYIYGSVLFRGIDPRTGKPPRTLEQIKENPQNL